MHMLEAEPWAAEVFKQPSGLVLSECLPDTTGIFSDASSP